MPHPNNPAYLVTPTLALALKRQNEYFAEGEALADPSTNYPFRV
jgi:hypothetical protein